MNKKYVKEFFFYPDVLVIGLLFVVSLSFSIMNMTSLYTWAAILIGVVLYVVSEYMTHRFLFHMKPPKNQFLLNLIKRLHYDHHTNPNNLHLLFLPLWYTIPNFTIVALIAYFVTGSVILTNALLTGLLFSLLFYEWKHYIAHRPVQPVTPWGRWMKKVHIWHHYKNENYWYGVTNPSMDYIMGTFKDEKTVEKSPTARKLDDKKENI